MNNVSYKDVQIFLLIQVIIKVFALSHYNLNLWPQYLKDIRSMHSPVINQTRFTTTDWQVQNNISQLLLKGRQENKKETNKSSFIYLHKSGP